ncbi:MAG: pentapeptide repeat-containing protein [Cyanobacteria bacterium P01_G01_bin.49]
MGHFIYLNQANLKQCDLSEATLKVANLEGANLTEVSALKTDFTGCNLTGACVEAWNIDHTTVLDNVDCQYVFLLEKENKKGSRERRPHDPDKVFQPGDFEQLYRKIMNTVQLLLRNGVNSDAFKIAFQKIMAENPEITYNSIQGIEKKGQDVLVTLEVPEEADKGNIEHTFNEAYEAKLEAAKQTALLEAEKDHKEDIKNLTKDITEITKLALIHQPNLTNIIDNKLMNHSSDSSQNINIRDINANQSIVNLGEISGKVSNNIQQLPDNSEDGKNSLKDLLTQLQTAIETEESLNDIQKAEALEATESLTQAANNPKDSNFKKLARLSKNALMGIASNLPNATKLVQEFNKLLPAIAQLLGL